MPHRTLHKFLVLAVATVGGLGFLPLAPGTWGSVAALLLRRPLSLLGPWWYGLIVALTITAALLVTDPAQKYLHHPDPRPVVVDEVVGTLVALAGLPLSWTWALAGFALFRLLDIAKPWPIPWFSSGNGALDVVADDVIAGLLTRLLLEGVFRFQVAVWG